MVMAAVALLESTSTSQLWVVIDVPAAVIPGLEPDCSVSKHGLLVTNAAAVEIAPGERPLLPKNAGRLSETRAVAQYATVGPGTPGTGLVVFACMLTVSMPDVVNPLAAASMQALSKLEDALPGAAAGQLAAAPHQTPLWPHTGPDGAELRAARAAAMAAASAAACAACCR
jgi:hypothetical protein